MRVSCNAYTHEHHTMIERARTNTTRSAVNCKLFRTCVDMTDEVNEIDIRKELMIIGLGVNDIDVTDYGPEHESVDETETEFENFF